MTLLGHHREWSFLSFHEHLGLESVRPARGGEFASLVVNRGTARGPSSDPSVFEHLAGFERVDRWESSTTKSGIAEAVGISKSASSKAVDRLLTAERIEPWGELGPRRAQQYRVVEDENS